MASETSEFYEKIMILKRAQLAQLKINPPCELFLLIFAMTDQRRIFIVPHSGAGEDTINMYFAQWAALFCFAALLAEQLGLNQVWSLAQIHLVLLFTNGVQKPNKATHKKFKD